MLPSSVLDNRTFVRADDGTALHMDDGTAVRTVKHAVPEILKGEQNDTLAG